jgi:hypothetical protein
MVIKSCSKSRYVSAACLVSPFTRLHRGDKTSTYLLLTLQDKLETRKT